MRFDGAVTDTTATLVAVAAVLGGLLAGLYAAFAVAVMPGLRRVDDRTFRSAMVQVNRAIQNPLFFVMFLGAPVAAVAAAVSGRAGDEAAWLGAAAILAVAGTGLTVGYHVPRNDALDTADPDDPVSARAAFEGPWTRGHLVRTALHIASFALLVLTLAR